MSRRDSVSRRISVRNKLITAATLAGLGFSALPVGAQVVTWTGGPGNWNDPLKWTGVMPNGAGFTAFVDSGNATASVVTVNGSFSVGTLSISANDEVSIAPSQVFTVSSAADNAGTLRIGNAAGLTMAGTVNNNGRIVFSPAGSESFLNVGVGPLTINGTGTIQFDWNGTGPAGVIQANSTGTLTLGSGQVVQGVGSFRNSRVTNNGLIDANSGTAGVLNAGMYIDPSNQSANTFINNGTMRSSNGGLMVIAGDAGGDVLNNGTISAIGDGSITELINGINIRGGTYTTTGTGVVRVRSGQTGNASDFTITPGSQFQVPNNARLNIAGIITNNGSLNVIAGASAAAIGMTNPATLQGSGTTRLTANPGVANATIDGQGTLTIAAGHTLAGGGLVSNARVINNGTIRADQVGNVSMYLDPFNGHADAMVNNSTIQAVAGAVVTLAGDAGGNFAGNGVYRADGAGARVQLFNNVSVVGGNYSTTAGGVVHVPIGHTGNVTDPTLTAGSELRVESNARLNVSGVVINNGSLDINAGTNGAVLGVTGPSTWQGSGVTRFNSTATTDAATTGQGTVTIAAGHTVRGDGYFNNARVINNGSIIGDDSVARLGGTYLDPFNGHTDAFINNGTIGVVSNNFLSLVGDAGGNFAGNGVYRADGANAFLHLANGVTVVGGNYTTTGGGVVRVPVSHTGNVVNPTITLGSVFNVDNNARLNISGTVTNNGSLTVTSGANNSALSVTSGGSATLTGSGVTRLTGNPGVTNATIDGQGTLTIAAGHTLAGGGYLNNTRVINNGTIRGDQVGNISMYLDPFNGHADAMLNNGTVQAATGAIVHLAGDAGGNFAGNGVYRADGVGAVVQLFNDVNVVGGNFTTTAGGEIRVPSAHTGNLNGSFITTGSSMVVQNNARLRIAGTVTNNGSLTITSGANNSFLSVTGSSTLAGSGVTRFTSVPAATTAGVDGQATLTIAAGHTVAGAGYFNNTRFINNGTIVADQPGNVSMYLDPHNGGTTPMVNNGTLRAAGGTLNLAGDFGGSMSGNGPLVADTGGTIQAINGITGNMGPVSGAGTYHATSASNLGHTHFRVGRLEATGGATARVIADGTSAGASRVGTLTINAAKVDLNDNDLHIQGGNTYAQITGFISTARAGGNWNGNGLTSSAAGAAVPKNKTLGALKGPQYIGVRGPTFHGENVLAADVLVKFTYYGDTDFNGLVNFDDYARVDTGFLNGGNDWFTGDFNYDNVVNFDDYALIDGAFLSQSGTLGPALLFLTGDGGGQDMDRHPSLKIVKHHFDQFGPSYGNALLNAVPEPASAALLIGGLTACVARRRRRSRND